MHAGLSYTAFLYVEPRAGPDIGSSGVAGQSATIRGTLKTSPQPSPSPPALPAAGPPAPGGPGGWLLPAALLLLTAFVFSGGFTGSLLTGSFLADDARSLEAAWQQLPFREWGWREALPLGWPAAHPLPAASFLMDRALFGQTPLGPHAVNLALHLLNVLLAFFLFSRLGLTRPLAFAAALVFALHPAQTGAVTYISGREELLGGFFLLVIFNQYLSLREAPSAARVVGMLVLFALGLAAGGEILAAPPLLLLAYEAAKSGSFKSFPHPPSPSPQGQRGEEEELSQAGAPPLRPYGEGVSRRDGGEVGIFPRRLPFAYLAALAAGFAALAALFACWRMGVQRIFTLAPGAFFHGGSLGAHLLSAAGAQVFLFAKLLFPWNLAGDYSSVSAFSASGWGDFKGWLFLAVLVLLLARWVGLRSRPRLFLAGAFVAAGLLAHFPLTRAYPLAADGFLYIPALGAGLAAAAGLESLAALGGRRRLRPLPTVAGVFLAILLGSLCWTRARMYSGPAAYWRECLRLEPQNARALSGLAAAESRGRYGDDALQALLDAARLDPYFEGSHYLAGMALLQRGKTKDALPYLQRAFALAPSSTETRLALAAGLFYSGDRKEYWEHLEWVRLRRPGDPSYRPLKEHILRELSGEMAKRQKSLAPEGAPAPAKPKKRPTRNRPSSSGSRQRR